MHRAHKLSFAGILVLLGVSSASAETFLFNGTFTQDDQQAAFVLVLNSPQVVTFITTSYANGGFAPVLSLFGDPLLGSGNPSLIATNSGGSPCGVRGTNPSTGFCLDALLGYDSVLGTNFPFGGPLAAGTYLLIVTEQDNTPNGPDLLSGFVRDGQGNFTAIPGVNNGPFVDPGNPNITGTGNYAFQVLNVDAASAVPEPVTLASLLAGVGILAGMRRWRTK